jgi:feruloyl esterase
MKISREMQILLCTAITALPSLGFAASCEELANLAMPDTTINLAESIAAGAFPDSGNGASYADLPAFCRVEATIAPTADSAIKIEVWLPAADWNGKFQGVGNGGWSGSISTAALATALRRGYATASTDTGHEGGSASFASGHPEKLIDYGWRAVHEMTVKGKALTNAFYGSDPRYAYFVGCSAGGKQGMIEAQRFPADYDGVAAGSPGLNWSGRALLTVHVAQAVAQSPDSLIPREKFAVINKAAIAACDSLDAVRDGVIEDPTQCQFDPQVLQCTAGDAADCLTPAQVTTARAIYAQVKHARTGALLVPGFAPGSELGWATMAGGRPFPPGVDLFKYIVFNNPDWDFKTMNWDTDVDSTLEASRELDALNTDLRPYFEQDGKIISWHGWADPQISPGSTLAYYQDVLTTLSDVEVQDNYRLFMVPGMNHCGGGIGTDQFDMLTALENWVENDQAPDSIAAAKVVDGQTVRTRPLCPVPQVAVYKGTGSTDEAANFACE